MLKKGEWADEHSWKISRRWNQKWVYDLQILDITYQKFISVNISPCIGRNPMRKVKRIYKQFAKAKDLQKCPRPLKISSPNGYRMMKTAYPDCFKIISNPEQKIKQQKQSKKIKK